MYTLECPNLRLEFIYRSGLGFRWQQLPCYNGVRYLIPNGDKMTRIEQYGNRLVLHCSDDSFYSYWFGYFDIDTDYHNINAELSQVDAFTRRVVLAGQGLRVLRQPLFEVIIALQLSRMTTAVYSLPDMVYRFTRATGEQRITQLQDFKPVEWYTFPDYMQVLENQDILRDDMDGWAIDAIIDICELIYNGDLDLELLEGLPYPESVRYLSVFPWFGRDMAEAVSLYGLHQLQAFPLSEAVRAILRARYGQDAPIYPIWHLGGLESFRGVMGYDLDYVARLLGQRERGLRNVK